MRIHNAAIVFLSLGLSLGSILGAPQPPAGDPINRDSPQSSVFAFLEAYRAKDFTRAAKYLDLRKLPRTERLKQGGELARQLGQILNRDTQFEVAALSRDPEGGHTDSLPANRERIDSFTVNGKTLDLELERITLRSGQSIWVVSSGSVDRIPQLAHATSDSLVEQHLPEPLVGWRFLDMSLWRWIALLLLAAVVAAFAKLLGPLVVRLVEPALKRFWPRVNWSAIEGFVGPAQLLLAVAVFRVGIEWIDPSAQVRPVLERGITLFFFGPSHGYSCELWT